MAHATTDLTHVRQGVPRPPLESGDNGGHTGQLCMDVDGQHFRVRTGTFSTQWRPDTPSHRHLTVVW